MKLLIIIVFCLGFMYKSKAQSKEAQQLLLNYEKLKQLKNMLQDMKKGYQILSKGYNTVKNIAEGNFSLHDVFFKRLMAVNPAIKDYKRVADILNYQKNMVKEHKAAFDRFSRIDVFNKAELDYFKKVYNNLLKQNLGNLDELTLVITSSQLSMSDDERLKIIDRIYEDTQDKFRFLKSFHQNAEVLLLQRSAEKKNLKELRNLYQIK